MKKRLKRDDTVGANFYRSQDLVPILVHVPSRVHAALKRKAEKEYRSLQQTVRIVLEKYVS